jgi:hypothetical protein
MVLALACMPGAAPAQSSGDIDALTAPVRARANPESLSTAYAAIINFAVSPEISTATFYPETDERVVDPRLKATRFPYRKVFGGADASWRPFVQAVAAYQEMDAGFVVTPEDFIDTRWKTYGLSLTGGVEKPVGEHLDLLASASVGYGRLENLATYYGPLAPDIRQALEGVAFNWELDALIYGAGIGAYYDRSLGRADLEVRAGLNQHRIESRAVSTSLVEFSSHISTFDVDFNTVMPTDAAWGGHPVAVVGLLGYTTFLGDERRSLGFDTFFEAGLALEIDLAAKGWRLKKLRIGAKTIFGPDISGWGLVIGPRF